MQRLKWPLFLLFTVTVFTAGLICGTYLQRDRSGMLTASSSHKQSATASKSNVYQAVTSLITRGIDREDADRQDAAPSPASGQPIDDVAVQPSTRDAATQAASSSVRDAASEDDSRSVAPDASISPNASATTDAPAGPESPGNAVVANSPARPPFAQSAPADEPGDNSLSRDNGAARPRSPIADYVNRGGSAALASKEGGARKTLPFKANPLDFSLHKLGNADGNTLLIVGGIQGDEPGGFSAAGLIASHYTITKGSVWVVPDLNMPSILNHNRGVYGDMNRKFAALDPDDPEYDAVMKIKSILLADEVGLVLNLHDGSGFYRPKWEDRLRNPKRWGQSLIIDQATIETPPFNLHETASRIEEAVNDRLLDPAHKYHIYNTYTADGNEEMAKTLSYFAICNGKPAFGVEASKEISAELRTFYHLQIIEAFMRHRGIEFERDFSLTPQGVAQALNSNLTMTVYGDRVVLPLENIRPNLMVFPFKKNSLPDVRVSKPLLALVADQKHKDWRVAYGNRTLTRLKPEFMDFDYSLDSVEMELDGKMYHVRLGEVVTVKDSFMVRHIPGYRVNAIGAQKEQNGTEADIRFVHKDFMPRFSLDTGGCIFRVEVYKENAFAGMMLVRFGEGDGSLRETPLTAIGGEESSMGF